MYSLDPYKILDLLGDLGGLLELGKVFGMIFTASIVKKTFDISLLSDTYQVQGYNRDHTEFYKSGKARECFQKQLRHLEMGDQDGVKGNDIKLTSSNEEEEEKEDRRFFGDIKTE